MKLIKKCPVFLLLLSTGLLFTIIGLGGLNNIYVQQDYDPLRAPVLSVMFVGLNEEHYPWQIFYTAKEAMAQDPWQEDSASEEQTLKEDEDQEIEKLQSAEEAKQHGQEMSEDLPQAKVPGSETPEAVESQANVPEAKVPLLTATPVPTPEPFERLEPLRESTREEYLNHISADIYGDAGVIRAATYEFVQVDESYFDDALFIGDSRTVGLMNYTDLSDHADFYCETSLTIYGVLGENFKGKGTIPDALARNDYGKIYIMVGINELGRGTTEDFMEEYTSVIDTLHELEPDALIFIEGIMRVTDKKSSSDAIFNNNNINARNNAIATLADNEQFFYIDVNEVVCDEDGNLTSDYTFDQIHLLGVYDELWKQFLLVHGVVKE